MSKPGKEVNMIEGPLFKNMVRFSIPIMLSGILQLLFNAADIVVVGRFTGKAALAAVGSTGPVINLLTNLFMGLSVGANVLVARSYGAMNNDHVSRTTHTATIVSLIGGVILAVVGIAFARPLMVVMSAPPDVLDQAVLYIQIYFAGMPAISFYNFGSSILKSVGNSKDPLYYLLYSGILNVILNLIFVIVFKMGVAGVAIATVMSQILAALLVFRFMYKTDLPIKVSFNKMRIDKKIFKAMMKIGLPAGFQGTMFSLSNVVVQSTLNSFGSTIIAANSAGGNIDGFIYVSMNSLQQTAVSFTSQNKGAEKYNRTTRGLVICSVLVLAIGGFMSFLANMFAPSLISIYQTDPEVIKYGCLRIASVTTLYCFFGLSDVLAGYLRGMGYSIMPSLITLLGVCVLRVIWLYTVFPMFRTVEWVFYCYPVSWIVTAIVMSVSILITCRKYLHPLAGDGRIRVK